MILTIDPSINQTGWAFGTGDLPAESGVIRTKGGTDAEKLHDLVVELLGVLDKFIDRGSGVDTEPRDVTAAVEVPEAFCYARSAKNGKAMNTRSLMTLSRAVGVILETLQKTGVVIEEVPASWKGTVGKKTVLAITQCTNHNEADAVMLYRWRVGRGGPQERILSNSRMINDIMRQGRVKRGR